MDCSMQYCFVNVCNEGDENNWLLRLILSFAVTELCVLVRVNVNDTIYINRV